MLKKTWQETLDWLREQKISNDLHLGAERAMLEQGSEQIDVREHLDPFAIIADYVQHLDSDGKTEFQANCSFSETQLVPDRELLRVELYKCNGLIGLSARILPATPPEFASLNWPPEMLNSLESDNGFIVISGPQNAGKTSLLASMLNHLNNTRKNGHILTLENPIEFVHHDRGLMVSQMHVGVRRDIPNYTMGLRKALRINAKIIAVTEIFSDDDTVTTALEAVEAGALVLITMHAPTNVAAISRLYAAVDDRKKERFWTVFSEQLRMAANLRLAYGRFPGTIYPVCELMIPDANMRTQLRDQDFTGVQARLMQGMENGSRALESELIKLVPDKLDIEEARRMAPDKDAFNALWATRH